MAVDSFYVDDQYDARRVAYTPEMANSPRWSRDPSVRERALQRDAATDGNVVNLLMGTESQISSIQMKLANNDLFGAKAEYDRYMNQNRANVRAISDASQIRHAGKTGENVAALAQARLNGAIDRQKVTVMGSETTIGAVLGAGSTFIKDNADRISRDFGFDCNAVGMYYGSDASGNSFDATDAEMMRPVMSPFFDAAKGGSRPRNAFQYRNLARGVYKMRDDLKATFGRRAGDVVRYVVDSHGESGGHTQVLESLMNMVKGYNESVVKTQSGDRVARLQSPEDATDFILDARQSLLQEVMGVDSEGRPANPTPAQLRRFDSTLAAVVKSAGDLTGKPFDFRDEETIARFKAAHNVFRRASDLGVNLHREMRDTGRSPAAEVAKYVLMGDLRDPGNPVVQLAEFDRTWNSRVRSNADFSPFTGTIASGRENANPGSRDALAGASGSDVADNASARLKQWMMEEQVLAACNHDTLDGRLAKRLSGVEDNAAVRNGMASRITHLFGGAGAADAARALSDEVLSAYLSKRPIDIMETAKRLASPSGKLAKSNPDAAESLGSFVAFSSDDEFKSIRKSLQTNYVANGMTQAEAEAEAIRVTDKAHKLKMAGDSKYLDLIEDEMSRRMMYKLEGSGQNARVVREVVDTRRLPDDSGTRDVIANGQLKLRDLYERGRAFEDFAKRAHLRADIAADQ